MSLSVAALVFGLMLVAELPDKTMIATIVLSSRYRPLPVWLGAAGAFVLSTGLAVVAGHLLSLAPHRVVQSIVATLFVAGATYLLLSKESKEEEEGFEEADRVTSGRSVALATFGVIFVAEFGDLTQVLIANLAARYHQAWSVFVGGALGLTTIALVGVLSGRALIRLIPLGVIRRLAGVTMAAMAAFSISTLFR